MVIILKHTNITTSESLIPLPQIKMEKPTSTCVTVPLGSAEHNLAQKHSQLQNSVAKAKQVYLNTLAVSAVNFYLNCLSIQTNLSESDCCNPLLLAFMDVADILLPGLGHLECRPVMPNAENLEIPPDVHSDRIGYLAVQLEHSLEQAVILGFTPTASVQIPLGELRSLDEFPTYLAKHKQKLSRTESSSVLQQSATKLSSWFEEVMSTGWEAMEALVAANPAQPVVVRETKQLENRVKRAKVIDLGVQLGGNSVVLALVLTTQPDETINILVQVYPSSDTPYLPTDLKLEMFSDSGKILQATVSGSLHNYAQLRRFSGEIGDRFSIAITLNGVTVREHFVL